jgi:ATP-binding cassette subfamily B protein
MPDPGLLEEEFTGQINLRLWRQVLPYALRLKKYFIPLLAISAVTAGIDASMFLAIRGVIDQAVARNAGGVLRNGLFFVALGTAQVSCVWVMIVFAGRAGQWVAHNIRRDVFTRLQELPFAYYDRRPVGWLMTRATSDCQRLGRLLAWRLSDLTWGFFMMIALPGVMFWCDWKISLIVFTVLPPLVLISMKFQKLLLHSSRLVRKTSSQIAGAYNEGIVAVRTTKTLLREDSNLKEFQQLTSAMRDQSVLNAVQSAMYLPFVQTLGAIGAGLALWFGGVSAIAGAMSVGTLVIFINCSNRFFDPVNEIARALTDFLAAQTSAERVMGLIATVPEIKDSPAVQEAIARVAAASSAGVADVPSARRAGVPPACSTGIPPVSSMGVPPMPVATGNVRMGTPSFGAPVVANAPQSPIDNRKSTIGNALAIDGLPARIGQIEFRDVSFAYKQGKPVLEHFNLTVPAGQAIALVGPTGGGKSTIAGLLCRFYEPTAGQILLDGIDYRSRSLHWLQSNLGIVLQTPHLFSGTVRENIRYGRLDATNDQIANVARLAGAEPFILAMENGYDSQVGQTGSHLSTGQKQLISLARAILADPQIFIMDEATSSVDTQTERLIQQGVEAILKGRTSFVIAHRLSTIRSADRIILIDKGQIVEQGAHHELILQQGRYYELYTNQFTHEKQDQLLHSNGHAVAK